MSNDEVDVPRNEDNKDFDKNYYKFLVYLTELMREKKLGEPCNCEEKHAC